MNEFKIGDRVKILPGVATPFVGMEGVIHDVRPHDGIVTMDRHIVEFERRERRAFFCAELAHVKKTR
jgi:transcription antitermination factor NusG